MSNQPRTVNELFDAAVARYGDSEFLRFKKAGRWESFSYAEVARRVKKTALGLHSHGIAKGERIAIWSENRPEWNIADLAVLSLGAVDVPIYTTQARSQVEYILSDSSARVIFVSSNFLSDALSIRPKVKSLETVICFDSLPSDLDELEVIDISALSNRGAAIYAQQPELYDSLRWAAEPGDLATLIYTSGTTGEPKGVMLTHKNLTTHALYSFKWLGLEGRRDVALSYLPLSHVFERGVWYVDMCAGSVVAYAESIDKVAENLAEVRPTVMTSVPRMFEKIFARLLERGASKPFPERQIFMWALDVAKKWAKLKNRGQSPGLWLEAQHRIADLLVLKKMREAVGGRIRSFISGGAPLASEIGYVFYGAGLPILEGYGLTETSPTISCNTDEQNRIGTVGRVIDGIKVKIADDGEILVNGDTVMAGYYNRPDADQEVFITDGTGDRWLCTGDVGYIDEDGFLVITDRKKELIKTSGGKFIAPQQLESLIKASRFVSQVVVIGNNRKFASALIQPNIEMLRSYAKLKGIAYGSDDDLLGDARIIDLIERQVEKFTTGLARFEKIKKIALLKQEFSVEGGELTPTLKPRRSVIDKKYAAVIERLYQEAEPQAAAV